MRRKKGLCALAPLLLSFGLLTDPASCCAVGGLPAPLTFTGMDCCEGPTSVCPLAMRNPASGFVGSSLIVGPAAATRRSRRDETVTAQPAPLLLARRIGLDAFSRGQLLIGTRPSFPKKAELAPAVRQ